MGGYQATEQGTESAAVSRSGNLSPTCLSTLGTLAARGDYWGLSALQTANALNTLCISSSPRWKGITFLLGWHEEHPKGRAHFPFKTEAQMIVFNFFFLPYWQSDQRSSVCKASTVPLSFFPCYRT